MPTERQLNMILIHLGCPAVPELRVLLADSLKAAMIGTLNDHAYWQHQNNIRWWQDPVTGQPIERNKGELIALMHSELSECLEGERKGLMDDHLPARRSAEVELADLLIRVFDYCGGFGYNIEGAYVEKTAYNKMRKDHTHEHRRAEGGKKF